MKLPIVGNRLGGTIFYDGGNVYTDINHISFAWKAPSITDLNYFSHTVGFGLRYPLRSDRCGWISAISSIRRTIRPP